jgi:hypothetical protein
MAIFSRMIELFKLINYFALRGVHCDKPNTRVPYNQRANPGHSLLASLTFTVSDGHHSGLSFVLYPCLGKAASTIA